MEIGFNKYQVFGKIILIPFLGFFFSLLIIALPNINFKNDSFLFVIFFTLIISLLFVMFIIMILELFFLPKGVSIDYQNKSLTLSYFFLKQNVINIAEIIDYNSTNISSKSTIYECLLINTDYNKTYLVGNFNLKDYIPIKNFLEESQVSFGGHKKISIVIYFYNLLIK